MADKAAQEKAQNLTKVITGRVRFSYVHIFTPAAMEGSDPKYSVSIIIDKEDKETIAKIEAAIAAAKEQGKGKWGGKIPANLKLPLRDGDKDKPEDEAYKGKMFVSASSKTKPGIVGRNPKVAITDETEVYSGCFGKASINFYPFAVSGSKGVACGLNHVQKLDDGEALGGRGAASDDFEEIEDEDILG